MCVFGCVAVFLFTAHQKFHGIHSLCFFFKWKKNTIFLDSNRTNKFTMCVFHIQWYFITCVRLFSSFFRCCSVNRLVNLYEKYGIIYNFIFGKFTCWTNCVYVCREWKDSSKFEFVSGLFSFVFWNATHLFGVCLIVKVVSFLFPKIHRKKGKNGELF